MKTKRVLILDGHPGARSLSRSLAEAYAEAARGAGHAVRSVRLNELAFDSDFGGGGYRSAKPLEPALRDVLTDLKWSEHLVLVTPMWWGGLPAKLKGLFDRILLPGEAFDTRRKRLGFPAPLLEGRTARVVVTSDTPGWLMAWFYRNALFVQLRRQVFGFVGIKPTRITHFTGASGAGEGIVGKWLRRVATLGERAV